MATARVEEQSTEGFSQEPTGRLARAGRRSHFRRDLGRAWKYRELYLLLPAILFLVIFRYIPMGGLVMGFQNYSPVRGFLGSPWVGFQHFETLFALPKFLEVFRNPVIISLYKLFIGFPVPIIFALLLNEVRHLLFKRTIQTVTHFPHFLSWVVYGGIMELFIEPGGAVPAWPRRWPCAMACPMPTRPSARSGNVSESLLLSRKNSASGVFVPDWAGSTRAGAAGGDEAMAVEAARSAQPVVQMLGHKSVIGQVGIGTADAVKLLALTGR